MQPGHSKRKQPLCILIADASAGGAQPLDALCEARGHEVHIVGHADAALAAARHLWPDVMAALGAGASQRGEAIEAGFDDELMKPVSAPALDALLRMVR
jgi:DNA-binding response OmpR family regulator